MKKKHDTAGARRQPAKTAAGGRPEKFEPAQIITALETSAGIISAAARMLRCSPGTIYNYLTRYPHIASELERIEEERLDLAEAGLIGFLGDEKHPTLRFKAIEFYLRTKGKSRGYTMTTEVVGKNGGPIETKDVTFDLSGLSPEEIAELEQAALVGVAKASRP